MSDKYGDNLTWFLTEIQCAEEIEDAWYDIYGENENGVEGSTQIDIRDLCGEAKTKIESLQSQLSQEKKRVELLAESIGKIAVELNVIDGSMPATGPQVLMIADDSLELIKNKQSQLSQQQKEHERQLLNAFQYAKHGHRTFSKFPEWAERMKIDVDHNCKPITEDK